MENTNRESMLSLTETISLAVGFAIGSGIITQTGIGIAMTGRSISLAFAVSALLFLIAFRPLFMMSTLLPRTSAAYTYSKDLIHENVGIFYSCVYFLGRVTIGIFGISFAQYTAALIPSLQGEMEQKLVAIGILTLFYVANLFGVKLAAKIQTVMCGILLCGILVFVVAGMGKVDLDSFVQEDFFTGGLHGFYSASSLLFFAVSGAYVITDFAPTIKNASRVVVKVIVGVTLGVTVLYTLMGIVASGTVSVAEAAGQPLTVAAGEIMPGRGWYVLFVVGACLGALVTTLNSSFVWYSKSLIRPCQDGYLPKKWAKTNRYGVPYILMTIFYLFGAVPTIMGIDLVVLSKMAIGLTILSICIPMMGIIWLPKKYPEIWANSKYAARYPQWRRFVMVAITYVILSTQVWFLFASNPLWSNVLIVAYVILVVAGLCIRHWIRKKKKI